MSTATPAQIAELMEWLRTNAIRLGPICDCDVVTYRHRHYECDCPTFPERHEHVTSLPVSFDTPEDAQSWLRGGPDPVEANR